MNSNIKQKEFWTGPAGKVWVEGKNEKDNMLLPLGNFLLKNIKFKSNMNILEIGCGTGYVMKQLRDSIGITGSVTGVDISQTMIKEAETYIKKNGLDNTCCKVLDAENDSLGESQYDLVCSRFGVMFFKNPFKAFENMYKALKNNSYIHFICWQDHKTNPWNSLPLRVVKKYIDLPKIEDKAPSPFAFANKEYIKEILVNANFTDINIIDHTDDIELFKGFELHAAINEFLNKTPVFTDQYNELSDKHKKALFNDLLLNLKNYYVSDALKFSSKTWVVSAKK
ncbi:MAG: hypothetical protein CMP15_00970 [Rickettsiales bacterium]|nr:hypothetical protein [Rickettsiales bacterium]